MTKKAAQATPNQLLRMARLERGWTQKEVADRIGAPLDLNVTRWERGTAWPSAYYVQKLCELFSKSASELGLLPPQLEATVSSQPEATRSENELPTGTITLLFAGMEASTRLLQQVGDRYASVLSECRQVLRAAFEQWNGHEVNTQGDAFFVVFARATDAVSAAVAAQRTLASHAFLEGVAVRVRVGLHTGEPQRTADGYVGLDVHRAARIMSAGHGGQVLLSQTTCPLIEQDLPDDVHLRDLGEHRLKDLGRPMHLFQLIISGLPADFPPLKTLDSFPNNLPAQPTPFLGREQEVAVIGDLLRREGVRLVTLSGPGGTGKTRLGLQVAAALSHLFASGVFFVNLAPISDPALVVPTIAETLFIREGTSQSLLERLQEDLRQKQMLLLLDNFEQVVSAAEQVAALLAACQELKVLVTSREVLHVRAEHAFPVPPLTLPDPNDLPNLAALSQNEAVALFLQQAQAVKPDFQVTNANARAIAEICTRLDGLPLAIELAAARMKLLLPQALLARLGKRLAVLTSESRDVPARQQTLRNTIAWSYGLLDAEEQQLFQRLSVFVGGCTLEAIEAVYSRGRDGAAYVFDGVASLLDKSLLRTVQQEGKESRLVMLETVREYGLERLAESGEREATQAAHARYFLTVAEQAEPELKGPHQAVWVARLGQEQDNLRAALEWALEEQAQERRGLALRLSTALEPFWVMRGPYSEARIFLERALAQSEGESASLRVRVLQATASIVFLQGDFDRLNVLAQQSLALYRELGDKRGIANALSLLAEVAEAKAKATESLALSEEQVRLMRQIGEPGEVAYALFNVAGNFSLLGEYARGQAFFEEALLLFRKVGNELMVGATLVWSAFYLLWSASSDVATVRQRLQQGQALISRVGDRKWMAHSSLVAALLALAEGDTGRAYELAQESLAIYQEMGHRRYIALTLYVLGRVEAQRSGQKAAHSRYMESLALAQTLSEEWITAFNLEGLAGIAAVQGAFRWAAQLWGAAEAQREGTAYPLPPIDRPIHERAVASIRTQLGEQAFAAAWQEGRSMKLEQVLNDVLKRGDEAGKQ